MDTSQFRKRHPSQPYVRRSMTTMAYFCGHYHTTCRGGQSPFTHGCESHLLSHVYLSHAEHASHMQMRVPPLDNLVQVNPNPHLPQALDYISHTTYVSQNLSLTTDRPPLPKVTPFFTNPTPPLGSQLANFVWNVATPLNTQYAPSPTPIIVPLLNNQPPAQIIEPPLEVQYTTPSTYNSRRLVNQNNTNNGLN